MDFMRYCENILEPTLDMIADLVGHGYVDKEHAYMIGGALGDIDSCLLNNNWDVKVEMLENILENFNEKLEKEGN